MDDNPVDIKGGIGEWGFSVAYISQDLSGGPLSNTDDIVLLNSMGEDNINQLEGDFNLLGLEMFLGVEEGFQSGPV
jgi:hypothetical protein